MKTGLSADTAVASVSDETASPHARYRVAWEAQVSATRRVGRPFDPVIALWGLSDGASASRQKQ